MTTATAMTCVPAPCRYAGVLPAAIALLLGACGSLSAAQANDTPPTPLTVDCLAAGACPVIMIVGSTPAATPTFTGFADPGIFRDPAVTDRLWLVYTFLSGQRAVDAAGRAVGVPHTSTRLARSDDNGAHWMHEAVLWSSPLTVDPEGRGPPSYFGSETPSLAAMTDAQGVTWYSVRLHYFLEARSAYAPRFATSWVMRVAAAQSMTPAALAQAPETSLGTGTTLSAYGVDVRLTSLDPNLAGCGFWNNPAIWAADGQLYVVAECLEFDGTAVSDTRSRMVVFSTTPAGLPSSWRWRYVGVLADYALAGELGTARLTSANISRASDGALLFVATPASSSGILGDGCTAIELASIDPPKPRRTNGGALVVRARQTGSTGSGFHTGACTHDAGSLTGLIAVGSTQTKNGLQADLRTTGMRP